MPHDHIMTLLPHRPVWASSGAPLYALRLIPFLIVISLLIDDFKAKFTNLIANGAMGNVRSSFGLLAVTLLYLGGMVFTSLFGRLDGDVAMIWVSSAVLATWLFVADRKGWIAALMVCGLANMLGAGWSGPGWTTGVFLTVANLGEAVAAALLARYTLRRRWPDVTFGLVLLFMLGTVVVIPAGSGLIVATGGYLIRGIPFAMLFHNWFVGHGVGLIAILPFGLTLATRLSLWGGAVIDRRQANNFPANRSRVLAAGLMLATMALLCVCVFMQDIRVPLVAPLLFALFAAVWADVLIATAMPVLVALIATPLTVAGLGPIAPGLMLAADRLQLGLVYAGMVACCSLPLVVEQARRRHEIARLSRSAAHFQAMSARADDLIEELRRVALTDPLTGLPNRRAFFDTLAIQSASGEPACLAMIDIDHFKLVNDRLGHAAGDTVLCHFSDMARKSFRASDIVARIGGEEFAVILRGVTVEQACLVCQRLVDRLAATDIATDKGPVRVTISSGIAAIGSDGHAAMASADQALYRAKDAGRSRLSSVA